MKKNDAFYVFAYYFFLFVPRYFIRFYLKTKTLNKPVSGLYRCRPAPRQNPSGIGRAALGRYIRTQ